MPWHFCGFALGFVTAKLGKEGAMACTVAVEEVIGEHYNSQINTLKSSKKHKSLVKKLQKFRDDELEHRDTAHQEGASLTKGYGCLHGTIGFLSKVAIFVSKRW